MCCPTCSICLNKGRWMLLHDLLGSTTPWSSARWLSTMIFHFLDVSSIKIVVNVSFNHFNLTYCHNIWSIGRGTSKSSMHYFSQSNPLGPMSGLLMICRFNRNVTSSRVIVHYLVARWNMSVLYIWHPTIVEHWPKHPNPLFILLQKTKY